MGERLWVPQYNFGSQVSEVGSSLPPCGSWGSSSGLQSWWQGLYPLSPLIWHFVFFSFSLSPHIYYPPLAPDLLLYSFPVLWLRSNVEWILLPQKSDCTAALTNSALTGTHPHTLTMRSDTMHIITSFIQQMFTEYQPYVNHWIRQRHNRKQNESFPVLLS